MRSGNRSLHQKCHLGRIPAVAHAKLVQRLPDNHPLDYHSNRSHLLSDRRNCRLSKRRLACCSRAHLRLETPRHLYRLHWLGSHPTNSFPILPPRPTARILSERPTLLAHPHHGSVFFFGPPSGCLDLACHRLRWTDLDSYLLPLPTIAATRSFPRRSRHRILLRHLRPRPRPRMAIRCLDAEHSVVGLLPEPL